jgi:galactokinase
MKLFVPGRVCLFGEHTDWAGQYRSINPDIEKGLTIITGTNQGIHAEIKPHPDMLIYRPCLNDGSRPRSFEIPMEPDILLAEAQKGGFFSYAAGVAFRILKSYPVRGLEIDNTLTDLPVKKGLSSSAAVCVLVARAFNRTYNLKMTIHDEMEYAYSGEITTQSRCGRMDQGCAYGNCPVMMTFDGDLLEATRLTAGKNMYFVIVDLCASKDTVEILSRLNQCYPFAINELQKNVQKYLGPLSARITLEAADAISAGNAERVGKLMTESQAMFDSYVQPACPSQLTAPVLHKVLGCKAIQPYIFGGKGVGSQGDGSAQFIARDRQSQAAVAQILMKEFNMQSLSLTLFAGRPVSPYNIR